MEQLAKKHCVPARPGTAPFTEAQALAMKNLIHGDWTLTQENTRLERVFRFRNFRDAMKLAVAVGEAADAENHHPDLHVSWGRLRVEITTHDIRGLAESDFILAAKVDALYGESDRG